jgi:hypothetical protein
MNVATAILTAALGLVGVFLVIFGNSARKQLLGIVPLAVAALIVFFTSGI